MVLTCCCNLREEICDSCVRKIDERIRAEEPDYLAEAMLIARGEMRAARVSLAHIEALYVAYLRLEKELGR